MGIFLEINHLAIGGTPIVIVMITTHIPIKCIPIISPLSASYGTPMTIEPPNPRGPAKSSSYARGDLAARRRLEGAARRAGHVGFESHPLVIHIDPYESIFIHINPYKSMLIQIVPC